MDLFDPARYDDRRIHLLRAFSIVRNRNPNRAISRGHGSGITGEGNSQWHAGERNRRDDPAASLMSNYQPDDVPANETDQTEIKSDRAENSRDKCANVQDMGRIADPSTGEQSPRIKDEGNKRYGWYAWNNDDDSRVFSGDICRICHMGGFPSSNGNTDARRTKNRAVRAIDSRTSTLSSYSYLGPLISACMCRGTVALVHAVCLERWLTESGHVRCELCGHKYATKKVPRHNILRSVVMWFNAVIATRQMLLDILYLLVTTPLAIFSCYICAVALKILAESGLYEIPWMIVAILPTCSVTLVAYCGWIMTLGRIHGRQWRRYWRSNFVVRLIRDGGNDTDSSRRSDSRSMDYTDAEEEIADRRNEEADELFEIF